VTSNVTSIELIDLGEQVTLPLIVGEGAVWLPDRAELAIYVGTDSAILGIHRQIQFVNVHGNVLGHIELPPGDERVLDSSTGYSEYFGGMDISPDGNQLILNLVILEGYETRRTRYESYLVKMNSSQYEPIFEGKNACEISWSPDGVWVAYIDVDIFIDGQLTLHYLPKDCDVVAPFPPLIRSPTWSSDASQLAFIYEGRIHVWDVQSWMNTSDILNLCQ
jgi:WD40 repeat protein